MKTRDRILLTSLELFNELGEPKVTTNHIADEMDISPGNLYYHFRNKDEIIFKLFEQFERQIDSALSAPRDRTPDMEDMWLYLHLIFESIWEFRFLYRDLDNILSRNRTLARHFRRVLDRKIETSAHICLGLVEDDLMEATEGEVQALAKNLVVVATYWLNFARIRARPGQAESDYMAEGVFQVMSMVVPWLKGDARDLLAKLAHVYLD